MTSTLSYNQTNAYHSASCQQSIMSLFTHGEWQQLATRTNPLFLHYRNSLSLTPSLYNCYFFLPDKTDPRTNFISLSTSPSLSCLSLRPITTHSLSIATSTSANLFLVIRAKAATLQLETSRLLRTAVPCLMARKLGTCRIAPAQNRMISPLQNKSNLYSILRRPRFSYQASRLNRQP